MEMSQIKSLIRFIGWGIFWSIILIIISFLIINFTPYTLKDVLFVEGIIVIIISLAASIGGDPMGLSVQALGQNNAQYVASSNLEITKMEKEKQHYDLKTNLRSGLNKVSLTIAGAICIIINFVI